MKTSASSGTADDVLHRLDALIAIQLRLNHRLSGEDPKREIGNDAVWLRKCGLKNPEIAAILSSTPNSVKELISRQQRSKKGKTSGKAGTR